MVYYHFYFTLNCVNQEWKKSTKLFQFETDTEILNHVIKRVVACGRRPCLERQRQTLFCRLRYGDGERVWQAICAFSVNKFQN
jgi:hypothetical protein